jgi:uncharacterized protein
MARTKKIRSIVAPPLNLRFYPDTDKLPERPPLVLSSDEFEAIRLTVKLKCDHKEAAEIMGISRPTFTRLLE